MQAAEAAQLLVAHLGARGVRRFVLSPGSRSAPLAYALAAGEQSGRLKLHVRLDERSAAFFALGLAKASGEPVAAICTSGTAVANFHPAVLEADLARVPFIILTADRPAELRGVLASQTIDQVGFFGPAVRGSLDLPAPGPLPDGEAAANVVAAANWAVNLATAKNRPGPVHLNLQYREPLIPQVA